jgi:hypothetical protein
MRINISTGAVFRVALYYGFAGFGGGYSVLAQLRRDLVERRKWLSADDFLVLAELSKSLPGRTIAQAPGAGAGKDSLSPHHPCRQERLAPSLPSSSILDWGFHAASHQSLSFIPSCVRSKPSLS